MNIYIAGGGRVGFHLAELLSKERQDVTVIEHDPDRRDEIDYTLDVSTAEGDGADAMLLQQLNVGACDIFVASMGNDEANLISAATARGLGAKRAVARVDSPKYVDNSIIYETVLGISYILSPDALAAVEIANYVQHPGILSTRDFGRGLIQMRQIHATKTPTVDGKTLKHVLPPGRGVLMGLVERKGDSTICHGDTIIAPGDNVTLIGHKEKLPAVQRLFIDEETRAKRVAIMGGSTIGLRVARAMEGKLKSIKLFERKEERANELAELLKEAKVVRRDATSRSALEQEHLESFDVFVAATRDDERNIMAAVLAKEVGVKSSVAVVHQPDFAQLVERLGVDLAVTPRRIFADSVLKLVHSGEVTSLAILGEGAMEVMELAVSDNSDVAGRKLHELKLPRESLITTILRGDKVIVPGGDDEIHAGDSLVVIAKTEVLDAVKKVLQEK